MSAYLSEDEQVESIKKWWKENGISVISGIALGFALIFGWQGWGKYQTVQGENASILFSTLENQVAAGDSGAAVDTGKRLIGEYGDSVYASFAAMQLARLSYQQGEKDAARSHLSWAMTNAPDPAIAAIARLRLGRLLLDMDELDKAAEVAVGETASMAGDFAELRGDIARKQGRSDDARAAYAEAQRLGVDDSELLQMKIVDLGGVGESS